MLPPCDLLIAGAGPAGLSAAINAASEGLRVTVLEPGMIGGQAHWSTAIENLAGFPLGITGAELASAMHRQAEKFGVRFVGDALATFCRLSPLSLVAQTKGGRWLDCRSLIIATGLQARPLGIPGADSFGVFSALQPDILPHMSGLEVAVIGGGNSAGQAVVALLSVRAKVSVFARRLLADTMSAYLIDRIVPSATIHESSEVLSIEPLPPGVSIQGRPFAAAFSFVGARPCHHYPIGLSDDYIPTSDTLGTSLSGVFAAGDVRADSTKRIATAIGDGSRAVASVHSYLKGLV